MFALKNTHKLTETISNPYSNKIYQALKNHQYRIVYKFNPENETITYFASNKKDDDLPEYLSCTITASGEKLTSDDSTDIILYFYICNKERNSSIEELQKIYSADLDSIEPLTKLSKVEQEERFDQRKEFLDFLSSLNSDSLSNVTLSTGDIHLYPCVYHSSDYQISFRIASKESRSYVISDLSTFVSNVNNRSFFHYGKELEFTHSKDCFDDVSKRAIDFISNNLPANNYYYRNNNIHCDENQIFDLLLVYQSQSIFYHDYSYSINPTITEVSIELDEGLKTNPPLEILKRYTFADKGGFFINGESKLIDLISLPSTKISQLIKFFASHPDFKLENVDDLFASKLLPAIEDKITISQTYRQKHKQTSFNIDLYLDLIEDTLIVKTIYRIGTNEVEKDEALQNNLYAAKVENYLKALNELGIEDQDEIVDENTINTILFTPLENLKKYCTILLSESLKNVTKSSGSSFNINANYNINWLEVSITSPTYTPEQINDILLAYRKKKRFYHLNDSVIFLDSESLSQINELTNELKIPASLKSDKPIPLYEIFKLSSYGNVHLDSKIKSIISDISSFKDHDFNLDPTIKSYLRPYQEDGFKWLSTLYNNKMGGILADDMGLGKTLQMIAFISTLNVTKPIIVISPKSLIYNWKKEFSKWNPSQKTIVINGSKSERQFLIKAYKKSTKIVFIVSYDTLRNDLDLFKEIDYSLILLDEAQYIKNALAQKTRAVKELKGDARFVLTGTPIENSLNDLWSIFDFLMPGYLLSHDGFEKTYIRPISEDEDTEVKKRLVAKISPFILRRTKGEVLKDLPPKIETIYTVSMTEEQRKLYDAYLQQTKVEAAKGKKNKISTLALITRLRQLCVDPSMFLENFNEPSEKLMAVVAYIQEAIANKHKILIFSSFTMSLDHLKVLLEKENIASFYISGKVSAKERLDICEKFNNPNDTTPVVLISLKAGNTGLNLIGGDIVIHLDPWWNVAAENQASDRAHRIGQKNTVNVVKMVCENSIEEKVIKLQEIKTRLTQDFISDNDESITTLSDEDIDYLLS